MDIAAYFNFKNIALFLAVKSGTPAEYMQQELNIDKEGRTCYHTLCYRGNYEMLVTLLNYERVCLKKVIADELNQIKKRYRFKNLDIKHGHLVSTVYHDSETVRNHADFNMRANGLFERYTNMIIERYRQILLQADQNGRGPLHYAAMSKFTKSYRTLFALLEIDISVEPEYDTFLKNYFEIGSLDNPEGRTPFDPRKSASVIKDFEHLLKPTEFKNILKNFKTNIKSLTKEALNLQDTNSYTPLHIASYYGDFKASRYMVDMGADPVHINYRERPLEVSKDKFARNVLQNLNDAASESNHQDLKYLVNCGELIDERMSITGTAPIHKAVLSTEPQKSVALNTIITDCNANLDTLDSNGWTALHHAAFNGDLDSATTLIAKNASVSAYSNLGKTALHFAAMRNHTEVIRLLLKNKAVLEA